MKFSMVEHVRTSSDIVFVTSRGLQLPYCKNQKYVYFYAGANVLAMSSWPLVLEVCPGKPACLLDLRRVENRAAKKQERVKQQLVALEEYRVLATIIL